MWLYIACQLTNHIYMTGDPSRSIVQNVSAFKTRDECVLFQEGAFKDATAAEKKYKQDKVLAEKCLQLANELSHTKTDLYINSGVIWIGGPPEEACMGKCVRAEVGK